MFFCGKDSTFVGFIIISIFFDCFFLMVGVTCRDQCSTASLQKMMGWELGLPGLFCGGRDSFYGG